MATWTHTFVVKANIDDIYRYGFAPDRWFTFYPAYAGLDGVEGDWPELGSVIRVRYRLVGQKTMTLRQEVIRHVPGRLIEMDERGLKDLWIDHPRFDFLPLDDNATEVTLTVTPDTAYWFAKPLIWLISQPFKLITPKSMKAFAASIETSAD